jgi:hypothetical protein
MRVSLCARIETCGAGAALQVLENMGHAVASRLARALHTVGHISINAMHIER